MEQNRGMRRQHLNSWCPRSRNTNNTLEVDHIAEFTKFEKERQRKGKGKMVVSRSKGDKKRDGTRSETQKVMGNAIAAIKVQTKRARKRGGKVMNLKSLPTHLPIMWRREEKKERKKGADKQKVLNGRVYDLDIITKFGMSNLFGVVSLQGWGHMFKPPTPYLHEPEVREFYYKMDLLEDGGIKTTVKGVEILLDEETLGIILGVPVEGIRLIEGCQPSSEFSTRATKRGDVKRAGLPKKFLKGEYQMFFEFINKVLVPCTEERTVASVADLFLME
ncbi:hypothetical protein H5410_050245, partial [Solanum commersonii]